MEQIISQSSLQLKNYLQTCEVTYNFSLKITLKHSKFILPVEYTWVQSAVWFSTSASCGNSIFLSTTSGTSGSHWKIISAVVWDTEKVRWFILCMLANKNSLYLRLSICNLHSWVSWGYIMKFIAQDNLRVNLWKYLLYDFFYRNVEDSRLKYNFVVGRTSQLYFFENRSKLDRYEFIKRRIANYFIA